MSSLWSQQTHFMGWSLWRNWTWKETSCLVWKQTASWDCILYGLSTWQRTISHLWLQNLSGIFQDHFTCFWGKLMPNGIAIPSAGSKKKRSLRLSPGPTSIPLVDPFPQNAAPGTHSVAMTTVRIHFESTFSEGKILTCLVFSGAVLLFQELFTLRSFVKVSWFNSHSIIGRVRFTHVARPMSQNGWHLPCLHQGRVVWDARRANVNVNQSTVCMAVAYQN